MKRSLLAAGAVGCLLAFYALAIGGIALVALVAVHTARDTGPGPAVAAAVGVLVVVLLLGTVISSVLRQPAPDSAALLLEEVSHPDLWAEVARIAEQVGTRVPDEIWLTPTPAITVIEDAGRLGLVGGTRRLALGVPLLVTLTRSEAHAVLAHELALWRGGFLGLSATAHRGQLTLAELASRDQGYAAVRLLLDRCTRLYRRVAHEELRRQELEADRVSAVIAGAGPTIAAIRQLPAVELLWERYVTEHAYAAPGLRPLRLFEGFAELWAQVEVQTELVAVRDEPVARDHTPYTSRPGTAERLDQLFEHPDYGRGEVQVDDTPAHLMIKRAGWHAIQLEVTMFRTSDLEPATWDEIADATGRLRVGERAAAMPERLDLCVTDLCPGPARVLTAGLVAPGASPEEIRVAAVELVSAAVESALLELGEARIVHAWTTCWRLVDLDGTSLDILALVAGAHDDDVLRDGLLEFVRSEGLADYRARATDRVELAGPARRHTITV